MLGKFSKAQTWLSNCLFPTKEMLRVPATTSSSSRTSDSLPTVIRRTADSWKQKWPGETQPRGHASTLPRLKTPGLPRSFPQFLCAVREAGQEALTGWCWKMSRIRVGSFGNSGTLAPVLHPSPNSVTPKAFITGMAPGPLLRVLCFTNSAGGGWVLF